MNIADSRQSLPTGALISEVFVNKFTRLRGVSHERPFNQDRTSPEVLRMRFYRLTLAASVAVLGACAGGDKSNADTVGVATDTAAAIAPAPTTAPAGTAPAAAGTTAPITGTTHDVKMVG